MSEHFYRPIETTTINERIDHIVYWRNQMVLSSENEKKCLLKVKLYKSENEMFFVFFFLVFD